MHGYRANSHVANAHATGHGAEACGDDIVGHGEMVRILQEMMLML